MPELAARGLLARVRAGARYRRRSQVLAPAFHHYLIPCPPVDAVAALRPHAAARRRSARCARTARIVGVMVTIEDVTARLDAERALAAALRSADAGARDARDRAAGRADAIEAPGAVEPALRDDDWQVRRAAVDGARRHARSALVDVAADRAARGAPRLQRAEQRAAAAVAHRRRRDRAAGRAAARPDADLRIQAALALGEQRAPGGGRRADRGARRSRRQRPLPRDRGARPPARAPTRSSRWPTIAESGDFFLAFPGDRRAGADQRPPRRAARSCRCSRDDDARASRWPTRSASSATRTRSRPLVAALERRRRRAGGDRRARWPRIHERYEARYGGGALHRATEFQARLSAGRRRSGCSTRSRAAHRTDRCGRS